MIRAKKSLGQNFLIDEKILTNIANYLNIENKNILEIGPGTGNLTEHILNKKPKKFTVIEKDNTLVKRLNDRFKEKLCWDSIFQISGNMHICRNPRKHLFCYNF